MSHKWYVILVSLLLIFFITTGCLGSKQQTSNQNSASNQKLGNNEVILRIASAETAPDSMKVLEEVGKEYEQKFGVKVIAEAIPLADIYTKVSTTVNTSSQYDIMLTGFPGHISLLQQQGLLEPMDEIVESLGGRNDFFETTWTLIDDKMYWIPYDVNLAFGYIRKDWLVEKGLSVPKNWEEFVNVADAFTDKSQNKYGLMLPIKSDSSTNFLSTGPLWSNDVKIFDDQWNVILDSPEMKPKVIDTLNLLKELTPYMPAEAEKASYAEMIAAFTSGQVGMAFYSGRLVDNIESKAPDLTNKFELFGYPTKDGDGSAVNYATDGIAVLKSPQSAEALKFVQWFFKEKLVEFLWTSPVQFFPAQESIYQSDEWRSHPQIQKYWEIGVEPQYHLLKNAKLNAIDIDGPHTDVKQGIVFESYIVPKMYQRVIINNEDPSIVVDEAAKEIREMIKGK